MKKEVTIGPDFIDYFVECDLDLYEPTKFLPLMNHLKKDVVMWNSKIEDLIHNHVYENYIINYEGAMTTFLEMVVSKFEKNEVEDVDVVKFKDLTPEDEVEYALVKASKDNIWLKSEENKKRLKIRDHEAKKGKTPKIKKEKKILYGSLTLPKSFEDYSKELEAEKEKKFEAKMGGMIGGIKVGKRYFHKRNDKFPFHDILKKILPNAKKVEIIDTYIVDVKYKRKKYDDVALKNIEFIAGLVSKNVKIKILTQEKSRYPILYNFLRCNLCKRYIHKEMFDAEEKNIKADAAELERQKAEENFAIVKEKLAEVEKINGKKIGGKENELKKLLVDSEMKKEEAESRASEAKKLAEEAIKKAHTNNCLKAAIPEDLDIEDSDQKMVRCTLCSEEMIVEGGDFSDHIDECSEASIPESIDIEDSNKKMVSCTLCSEEMIVEGGDFSDHIDECPEGSIPKGLSIHDYDPVQEIKEHLNEKYQNITLSIPPQIHDRFIITDKYEILLGSGLQAYVDNTVIMGGINTTVLSVDDDK